MRSNTRTQCSDSQNPVWVDEDRPALVVSAKGRKAAKATRPTRLYTLTEAALEALSAPLPMDNLPHIEVRNEQ